MAKQELCVILEDQLQCDRYDAKNFIARGGFAEVYAGTLNSQSPVAIKFYKPLRSLSCLSDDGHLVDHDDDISFKHEAEFLCALISPNIVRLEGVQHDAYGTINVIVMELAMCSLNHILYMHDDTGTDQERKILSLRAKLSILHDAIAAIEFTHVQGITHNDIKPDNFLLFSNGHLKLTDFGLASYTSATSPTIRSSPSRKGRKHISSPKPTAPVGRPAATDEGAKEAAGENLTLGSMPKVMRKGNTAYQAPELFVSPARCVPASDVYAFGIVMNEVLTGCRPFSGVPGAMLPVQICGGARPVPLYGEEATTSADMAEVDKRLRHLVRTCWEGRARERPHSDSVAKTLARLLASAGGECREEVIDALMACAHSRES